MKALYILIILGLLLCTAGCSSTPEVPKPTVRLITIIELKPSVWELGKDSGVFIMTQNQEIFFSSDPQVNQFLKVGATCTVILSPQTQEKPARSPASGNVVGLGGACVYAPVTLTLNSEEKAEKFWGIL
jgi:hypothetical protein